MALLLLSFARGNAGGLPPHPIVAYLDSWNETPVGTASDTALARLPGYISVVDLAFARPDLTYDGGLDLAQTGLEYRYSGRILRDAIALLKARHPATKVLLSVGGAVYTNWSALDPDEIARLVRDLGADGVDIDYEPSVPGCVNWNGQHIHCWTEPNMEASIGRLRGVLPRPAILTASVWSVGAYGEGAYRDAKPLSRYTGMMLDLLRSPAATALDMLCVNAYDAGPQFQPLQAFQAYRAVWPGMLALGLAVQRQDGDGPYFTAREARTIARQVAKDPRGGMMVYPLLAAPAGRGSANRPDGEALARAMCRGLDAGACDAKVP